MSEEKEADTKVAQAGKLVSKSLGSNSNVVPKLVKEIKGDYIKWHIVATCPTCSYSEEMVRLFWDDEPLARKTLENYYEGHAHKVELQFEKAQPNAKLIEVPLCVKCGKEHTMRPGQVYCSPCEK